ncbi:Protein of unknown function [Gryllus bimaculatus]|nr:Protein of unknown function [Gryllus bimaculatus]
MKLAKELLFKLLVLLSSHCTISPFFTIDNEVHFTFTVKVDLLCHISFVICLQFTDTLKRWINAQWQSPWIKDQLTPRAVPERHHTEL